MWDCSSSCVFVGNRLVDRCGPSPEELCTPCKPNRFTVQPKSRQCSPCTQCVGMWCGHPFCCLCCWGGGGMFLYSTFKVPIWPFLIMCTLVEQKYLDTSGLGSPHCSVSCYLCDHWEAPVLKPYTPPSWIYNGDTSSQNPAISSVWAIKVAQHF